jgi:hypothetical protein
MQWAGGGGGWDASRKVCPVHKRWVKMLEKHALYNTALTVHTMYAHMYYNWYWV